MEPTLERSGIASEAKRHDALRDAIKARRPDLPLPDDDDTDLLASGLLDIPLLLQAQRDFAAWAGLPNPDIRDSLGARSIRTMATLVAKQRQSGTARPVIVRPANVETSDPGVVASVVAFVLAAGGPYFTEFFGGRDRAAGLVHEWVLRDSSELHLSRWSLLLIDGQVAGGHLCLRGDILARCRATDAFVALREDMADDSERLTAFLAATKSLFAPVPRTSYYLSKTALMPEFRGQGLGDYLFRDCLAVAIEAEGPALQLDVHRDNRPAIAVYRRYGFRTIHTGHLPDSEVAYLSMSATLQPGTRPPNGPGERS